MWELDLRTGDRLLLCSDGLTNEVDSDEMAGILGEVDDPAEAARATGRGGQRARRRRQHHRRRRRRAGRGGRGRGIGEGAAAPPRRRRVRHLGRRHHGRRPRRGAGARRATVRDGVRVWLRRPDRVPKAPTHSSPTPRRSSRRSGSTTPWRPAPASSSATSRPAWPRPGRAATSSSWARPRRVPVARSTARVSRPRPATGGPEQAGGKGEPGGAPPPAGHPAPHHAAGDRLRHPGGRRAGCRLLRPQVVRLRQLDRHVPGRADRGEAGPARRGAVVPSEGGRPHRRHDRDSSSRPPSAPLKAGVQRSVAHVGQGST